MIVNKPLNSGGFFIGRIKIRPPWRPAGSQKNRMNHDGLGDFGFEGSLSPKTAIGDIVDAVCDLGHKISKRPAAPMPPAVHIEMTT